jgi:AmmeMemoRadiSam system protein B/AmmeMemoRadiSam system protein A
MWFLPIAGLALVFVAPAAAQVHASPMAGRWFPPDRAALEKLLDTSYSSSSRRVPGPPRKNLLGLVVPHAGLQYSGTVAASSYRLLDERANIIVLGFSHRFPLEGVAAPRVEAYTTPLGEVKVNRDALRSLGFPVMEEKELCDHSLENQLPFLQRSAPNAQLIPLYVGSMDAKALGAAARKLARRVEQGDLIIASSDFTHFGQVYGYTPFAQDSKLPERLRDRATEAFEQIGSLDHTLFDRFLTRTGDTICGRDPIRLLMATLSALRSDVYMATADYMASGELSGDYSTSVGYGSLAFYPAAAFSVSEPEQKKLLAHSRSTLDAHLAGKGAVPAAPRADGELSQRTGAFVTIRKDGELRGCIGILTPNSALPATVADRTLAAARSDPRFRALSAADGPVTLEISLLTPLKLLRDWRSYREGLGAVIMQGERGGLLLPQVAKEMNWNRDQFLAGLSEKAGLEPNAYRNGKVRLYVFSAQVFGEATETTAGLRAR